MTIQRNTITAPCFRRQRYQISPLRPQCGQGDEAAGEKRLHAGGEAGRPSDAERMRLPRAGRRGAGGAGDPTEYIGLVAPPRTKRGIGARATSAARPSLAPPAEDQKHSNETPRNGKICALCMIRGIRAAKSAPSWQDLRAMHSRKAICGAFRMHGAHILPKPAHFGCMAAICCQEGALFPSEGAFGTHEAK